MRRDRTAFFCYRVLDRTQSENTTAVAISIAQAASEQPRRIKAIPTAVAGAMAAAATPARDSQHPATFKNHLFFVRFLAGDSRQQNQTITSALRDSLF